MEKKNHSKGELSVKKCTNDGYRVQINGKGRDGGCKIICWTRKEDYAPLPNEEEKANAELIVTAVNAYEPLLNSLKGAYEYFSRLDFNWEGRNTSLGQFVLSTMRNAIEKAENKQ